VFIDQIGGQKIKKITYACNTHTDYQRPWPATTSEDGLSRHRLILIGVIFLPIWWVHTSKLWLGFGGSFYLFIFLSLFSLLSLVHTPHSLQNNKVGYRLFFDVKFDHYSLDLVFFLIHHLTFGWLEIEFCNFFYLFSMGLSRYHDLGCMLTRVVF